MNKQRYGKKMPDSLISYSVDDYFPNIGNKDLELDITKTVNYISIKCNIYYGGINKDILSCCTINENGFKFFAVEV